MTHKQIPFYVVFAVLLAGALACASLGGGASPSQLTATANAKATAAKAAAATPGSSVSGSDGQAMGPANARVTVAEYGDFQCPICKEFHQTTETQFVAQYVKTGKVRFEYHHYIVIDSNVGGHESERAAEATECASAQGKFWPLHDTLFAHQGSEGSGAFADDRLLGFAQSVGVDMTAFKECFASSAPAAAVKADMNKGDALGVQGTPTVFINGAQVPDPFNYNAFKALLDAALAHS